jgi:hypothetical protein
VSLQFPTFFPSLRYYSFLSDVNLLTSFVLQKALSYAIVLTIEEAFNCVLDAEDLDNLISSPNARDQKNITYLYTKRLAITEELFKLLSVYVPKQGALPDEHQ